MGRTTIKTSTILASTDRGIQVFSSREQMPAHLRAQLEKSITGGMAATVLIADPRGRDEILKTLRGEVSALNEGVPGLVRRAAHAAPPKPVPAGPAWLQSRLVRVALAFGIPVIVGLSFGALLWFQK
jgi:hypothetical protein